MIKFSTLVSKLSKKTGKKPIVLKQPKPMLGRNIAPEKKVEPKPKPKEVKPKKKRKIPLISEIAIVVVLAILLLARGLYSSNDIQITPLGTPITNQKVVLSKVETDLEEIKSRSFIYKIKPFAPRDKLSSYLDSHSDIASYSIISNATNAKLEIKIDLVKPIGVTIDETRLMGLNGKLLATIPTQANLNDLPLIISSTIVPVDFSSITPTSGSAQLIPEDTAQFISRFDQSLYTTGLKVFSYTITDNPRELRIDLEGDVYILALTSGDGGEQAAAAVEALTELKDNVEIDYIDVRLAPRVIYK